MNEAIIIESTYSFFRNDNRHRIINKKEKKSWITTLMNTIWLAKLNKKIKVFKKSYFHLINWSLLIKDRYKKEKCPFLGTIKRHMLDFDFEKLCSVNILKYLRSLIKYNLIIQGFPI